MLDGGVESTALLAGREACMHACIGDRVINDNIEGCMHAQFVITSMQQY